MDASKLQKKWTDVVSYYGSHAWDIYAVSTPTVHEACAKVYGMDHKMEGAKLRKRSEIMEDIWELGVTPQPTWHNLHVLMTGLQEMNRLKPKCFGPSAETDAERLCIKIDNIKQNWFENTHDGVNKITPNMVFTMCELTWDQSGWAGEDVLDDEWDELPDTYKEEIWLKYQDEASKFMEESDCTNYWPLPWETGMTIYNEVEQAMDEHAEESGEEEEEDE